MTSPLRFAINGFGRIGRSLARAVASRRDLELVAVNDLASAPALAGLLARDTVHGAYPGRVATTEGDLEIDGRRIATFAVADPAAVPWERTAAQVVVEASGRFTARQLAAAHLRGEVRSVLVSAISPDADGFLCPGVEPDDVDPRRQPVLSALSCTSHCLALLLAVIDATCGLRHGLMNEVHSLTGNQRLVDGPHPDDPRRGRAAAHNIVPTSTAAPAGLARLLPRLAGRLAGRAVRVPTPDVALLDLVFTAERRLAPGELEAAFRAASAGSLRGLLGVSDEPLVSSDFVGDPRSAIVDLPLAQETGGELHRVMAWYDNEHAYACRLAEQLSWIARRL